MTVKGAIHLEGCAECVSRILQPFLSRGVKERGFLKEKRRLKPEVCRDWRILTSFGLRSINKSFHLGRVTGGGGASAGFSGLASQVEK